MSTPNPFGINPYAAATTANSERNYNRSMAELKDQMVQEQLRGAAEVGAMELSQYGERGAALAERLRSDPLGTVRYIDAMGGMGALTNQLRYGHAVGESARQGSELDPLSAAAFTTTGAEGLAQLGTGAANQALAGQRDATANVMNNLASGGMGPASGLEGVTDLGNIAAMTMANPQLGRALLGVRAASREPDEKSVSAIQRRMEPIITDLSSSAEDMKFVKGLDYNNPAQDAWLSKLFVQTVEPGLAVLPGEEKNVVTASTSRWDEMGIYLGRTFTKTGRYTPETRRLMAESIWKGRSDRIRSKLQMLEGVQEETYGLLGEDNPLVGRALFGADAPRSLALELLNSPPDFSAIAPNDSDVLETPAGRFRLNLETGKYDEID